jgi:hypothetical protein
MACIQRSEVPAGMTTESLTNDPEAVTRDYPPPPTVKLCTESHVGLKGLFIG